MAKTYNYIPFSEPTNLSVELLEGGVLNANTTYWVAVIGTILDNNVSYNWGASTKPSELLTIKTTDTKRTIKLRWNMPKGEVARYRVWVSTVNPAESLNGKIAPPVGTHPRDVDINDNGVCEYIEDGSSPVGSNCYLRDYKDMPSGILELSGGVNTSKFSIVDLYNKSEAEGWGIIEKYEDNTYRINTSLNFTGTTRWADTNKTIIFNGIVTNGSRLMVEFGNSNLTGGCHLVTTQPVLNTIEFGEAHIYSSTLVYRGRIGNYGSFSFGGGVVQNCVLDNFRNFNPTGNENCLIKDVTYTGFDNAFSAYRATFDGMWLRRGSRVFQFGANTKITARGVDIEGAYALLCNAKNSVLNLIDSKFTDAIMVNSADREGTMLNDYFSMLFNITDDDGEPIENATIKVYDKDQNLLEERVTDNNGDTEEALILRERHLAKPTIVPPISFQPFTIEISANGYETYNEIVSYESSRPIIKTITLKKQEPIRTMTDGACLALEAEKGSKSLLMKI